ncbi:aminoglycoside 6-adenylyltransferase [Paenibacillus sp. GSMTC-2017]|uniref:aminoglycoside 6-adenylyltransferase n=1 Tax=Paenibacillus sp. GSMTC-2017 TaxID=2794350 RepID=UPI0018D6D469|nr:aminoglycoside 6-adenylyltransferase [Paenibacillus sp. GSMTC-2017]MBH5319792.1 aminoglycoside 6-adenylyltransferase [Paenibacillus sp. GSMTC-2017]
MVTPYIAKGLWRGELSYVKYFFERPVRNMLVLMLDWYIGVQSNFESNPGKLGKYYEQLLPPELWQKFVSTFPDADEANIWRSLYTMGELFRETAKVVSDHYGFTYNEGEDERVTAYLKHVQSLPRS